MTGTGLFLSWRPSWNATKERGLFDDKPKPRRMDEPKEEEGKSKLPLLIGRCCELPWQNDSGRKLEVLGHRGLQNVFERHEDSKVAKEWMNHVHYSA